MGASPARVAWNFVPHDVYMQCTCVAQVYITGTFNNWSAKVPMHRSGNDFTFICPLAKVRLGAAV